MNTPIKKVSAPTTPVHSSRTPLGEQNTPVHSSRTPMGEQNNMASAMASAPDSQVAAPFSIIKGSPSRRKSSIASSSKTPMASSRRSVCFGKQLSPELFDKNMPPATPVKRGAAPAPAKEALPFGSPLLKVCCEIATGSVRVPLCVVCKLRLHNKEALPSLLHPLLFPSFTSK